MFQVITILAVIPFAFVGFALLLSFIVMIFELFESSSKQEIK